jgi:hypothetical protein
MSFAEVLKQVRSALAVGPSISGCQGRLQHCRVGSGGSVP